MKVADENPQTLRDTPVCFPDGGDDDQRHFFRQHGAYRWLEQSVRVHVASDLHDWFFDLVPNRDGRRAIGASHCRQRHARVT